jgi:hypothetical protein
MKVIRYKPNQTADGEGMFPEDLYGVWHLIGPIHDYTVCGHATDEYEIEEKQGIITCRECLRIIGFYKKLKAYK